MKYRLKDYRNRTNTNLRAYSRQIANAVLSVFPTATVNVYPEYFEIMHLPSTTNKLLRNMGKAIAAHSTHLDSIKKTYGNSTQLFVRF